MPRYRICLLSLTIAALVAGCGGYQTRKRAESLDEATTNFETLLRWGEFEDAGKYAISRKGEPEKLDLKFLKHIRVTSYEITDQAMASDQSEAAVTAVIGFYDDESAVLHTMHNKQIWWYDADAQHWFMDSGFPDFKAELIKNR